MRSHIYGKSDYFLRIKRKPAQEDLYQRVVAGNLTDEEIENCGQPLWVREALAEIKLRGGKTQWETINALIADTESAQEIAKNQTYPVYEWTAESFLIVPQKGFDLEVLTGEWILVDRRRNQVKVDYTLLNVDSAIIETLIGKSPNYLGEFTEVAFITSVGKRKQPTL
jgi:hypothetical protein